MNPTHYRFLLLLTWLLLTKAAIGANLPVRLTVLTGGASGIYYGNERINIKVITHNEGLTKFSGTLTCRIFTDEKDLLATQSKPIRLKGKKENSHQFKWKTTRPGFYRAVVTFKDNKISQEVSQSRTFGYEPEKIKPTATLPLDFNTFWVQAKAELAAVTPAFKRTLSPQHSTTTHRVYEVHMQSIGSVLLKGWLSVPNTAGPHPVYLRFPGYYAHLIPDKNLYADYAVFYFHVRGHGISTDEQNSNASFLIRGLEHQNDYFYRRAFLDCLRALDFIYAQPDIDTTQVAVGGGSQGGAFSLVAAALDKRVNYCAPDMPFLADFSRYLKIAPWPASEFEKFLKANPEKIWADVLRVLQYFDVVNFAPLVTCPVLLSVGLQDETCPPAINLAAYNALGSTRKQLVFYSESGHKVPDAQYQLKDKWLLEKFNLKRNN